MPKGNRSTPGWPATRKGSTSATTPRACRLRVAAIPDLCHPVMPDYWRLAKLSAKQGRRLSCQFLKVGERQQRGLGPVQFIHAIKNARPEFWNTAFGRPGRLKPLGGQGKQNQALQSLSEDILAMVSWDQSAGTAFRSRASVVKPPPSSPAAPWQLGEQANATLFPRSALL